MADVGRIDIATTVPKTKRDFSLALVISGLLLGILAGLAVFVAAPFFTITKVTAETSPGAHPPNAINVSGAPVTLEHFSDFQCEPCESLHETLKKIEAEYGVHLRIVFRQFPLKSHANALEAARAAEAAGLQGQFFAMHDHLFDNQPAWASSSEPRAIFQEYARWLKLDVDRFTRDLYGPEVDARIMADRQRGQSLGVRGTPLVLLNDRQVRPTAVTYDGLAAAINAELKRASAGRRLTPTEPCPSAGCAE